MVILPVAFLGIMQVALAQGDKLVSLVEATRLPYKVQGQFLTLTMKDEEENRFFLYMREEEGNLIIAIPVGAINSLSESIIREITDKLVVKSPWKKLAESGVQAEIALGDGVSFQTNQVLVSVRIPARRLFADEAALTEKAKEFRQTLTRIIAVASVAKAVVELVRK